MELVLRTMLSMISRLLSKPVTFPDHLERFNWNTIYAKKSLKVIAIQRYTYK